MCEAMARLSCSGWARYGLTGMLSAEEHMMMSAVLMVKADSAETDGARGVSAYLATSEMAR